MQRELYLQGPIKKPIGSVSPNTKMKIYTDASSKKKKAAQPLGSRVVSAQKTLGESSDDKHAPPVGLG